MVKTRFEGGASSSNFYIKHRSVSELLHRDEFPAATDSEAGVLALGKTFSALAPMLSLIAPGQQVHR
ncbi:hypothetical protein BDZ89DRAFT_1070400 [Hymenopellis radicata]|nr:hypothetical protein BDZ89DRAFT_1070400 [Hymenopellis radicata]